MTVALKVPVSREAPSLQVDPGGSFSHWHAKVFSDAEWQRPVGTEETEVPGIDHRGTGRVFVPHRLERGGSKLQRGILCEAHRVLRGRPGMTDARAVGEMTLQQPYRGIEVKRERLFCQLRDQRICRLPICTGHRIISFRC